MIRNPWKLEWTPPQDMYWDNQKGHFCQYAERFNLVCMSKSFYDKTKCKTCLMRQKSLTFRQMSQERVKVDRVCDRCGEEIPNPDTVLYLLLEDRGGKTIVNMEICRSCGAELADWLNGLELPAPEVEDQLTAEELWG